MPHFRRLITAELMAAKIDYCRLLPTTTCRVRVLRIVRSAGQYGLARGHLPTLLLAGGAGMALEEVIISECPRLFAGASPWEVAHVDRALRRSTLRAVQLVAGRGGRACFASMPCTFVAQMVVSGVEPEPPLHERAHCRGGARCQAGRRAAACSPPRAGRDAADGGLHMRVSSLVASGGARGLPHLAQRPARGARRARARRNSDSRAARRRAQPWPRWGLCATDYVSAGLRVGVRGREHAHAAAPAARRATAGGPPGGHLHAPAHRAGAAGRHAGDSHGRSRPTAHGCRVLFGSEDSYKFVDTRTGVCPARICCRPLRSLYTARSPPHRSACSPGRRHDPPAGGIVLATAYAGVAAQLLDGGRTKFNALHLLEQRRHAQVRLPEAGCVRGPAAPHEFDLR